MEISKKGVDIIINLYKQTYERYHGSGYSNLFHSSHHQFLSVAKLKCKGYGRKEQFCNNQWHLSRLQGSIKCVIWQCPGQGGYQWAMKAMLRFCPLLPTNNTLQVITFIPQVSWMLTNSAYVVAAPHGQGCDVISNITPLIPDGPQSQPTITKEEMPEQSKSLTSFNCA